MHIYTYTYRIIHTVNQISAADTTLSGSITYSTRIGNHAFLPILTYRIHTVNQLSAADTTLSGSCTYSAHIGNHAYIPILTV